MKQVRIVLITLSSVCFIVINSCSQTINSPASDIFVGSTPCDSLIKSLLRIPTGEKCEFIKWDLSLYKNQIDSDTFTLSALYGESKPNTNGFINGGKKIEVTGKYTISYGMNENPRVKVYHLNTENFQSPVLLAEMDNNILHFVDSEKKFIVGNGGWGYVLNRIKK